MDFWKILLDTVFLLGTAMLFGGMLARLGQSPIVGYLLAGMVLGGPGSAHLIQSEHEIEALSELGVALLLFSLGLEFSWKELRAMGGRLLAAGGAQVALTMGAGTVAGVLAGFNVSTAIAFAAMISLSSTACVLRTLIDRGELDSSHGRHSLSILLVQDIAVVFLAILILLLSKEGSFSEVVVEIAKVGGLALALVAGLYLFVNKIAVFALGAFGIERNRDLSILLAVTVGLGSTWLAHELGMSPALGAFVAGMFLGGSPFAVQARADVASLRVILLTLFFGSAGMVADPVWIMSNWYLVFGLSLLLFVAKALIVTALLCFLRQPLSVAIATGLAVGQIGEFGFVLGKLAQENFLLSDELYLLVVSCAIVTLLATPFVLAIAPAVGRRVAEAFGRGNAERLADETQEINGSHPPRVLIIGFGPAGQIAGAALSHYGEEVLVIDINKSSRSKAAEQGFRSLVGDATSEDLLHHANVSKAEIAVITLPNRPAVVEVIRNIRKLSEGTRIIARARHHRDVAILSAAGADRVVDEEEQMGLALSAEVEAFGLENHTPAGNAS